MLFHEPVFLFAFLPVTLVIFFALVKIGSDVGVRSWIILASLFFYSWSQPDSVAVFILSALANYVFAECIARTSKTRWASIWLVLGVSLDLGILCFYKYANFLLDVIHSAGVSSLPQHTPIHLPIAISFFTFTEIAYLVDVYRDRQVHYRLVDYGAFVFFFPHLVAGPIVRHWELIPQFRQNRRWLSADDAWVGSALFLIGLFKKVLIADPLSAICGDFFSGSNSASGATSWEAWISLLAFTGQIYFDFSGYSDMAIGLARLFGIRFPQNFCSPYKALSIIDFWHRWHITLSRFFRDYLYIPLGGNRHGFPRQMTNLFVTMVLCGFWHGAGWTFAIWGAGHGALLVVNHAWQRIFLRQPAGPLGKLTAILCWFVTFLSVVLLWVLFRSDSLAHSCRVYGLLFGVGGFTMPESLSSALGGLTRIFPSGSLQFVATASTHLTAGWDLVTLIAALAIAWLGPNSQELLAPWAAVLEQPKQPTSPPRLVLRPGWATGLLFSLFFFVVLKGYFVLKPNEFIYFRF